MYQLLLDGVEIATVSAADDATLLDKARQIANESYHGDPRIERGQCYVAVVYPADGGYLPLALDVREVR